MQRENKSDMSKASDQGELSGEELGQASGGSAVGQIRRQVARLRSILSGRPQAR